jgi:hypothetical protein
MEQTQIEYKSEFLPDVTIVVVFSNDPLYPQVKEYFEEYGYGFMVPNKNLVIIDGDVLMDEGNEGVLKFIEAHEVSHILLDHSGPRDEREELEADLGAYLILQYYGYEKPIELLLKHFKERHGMEFNEDLLPEISKKLGLTDSED